MFVIVDSRNYIWFGPFDKIQQAEKVLHRYDSDCGCGNPHCKVKVNYLKISII